MIALAYGLVCLLGLGVALAIVRSGRVVPVPKNAACLDARKAETEARIAARHEAERRGII